MANEYPSMIQVKDEMISDYDYETVRENPCHESSIYTDDMTMIQVGPAPLVFCACACIYVLRVKRLTTVHSVAMRAGWQAG